MKRGIIANSFFSSPDKICVGWTDRQTERSVLLINVTTVEIIIMNEQIKIIIIIKEIIIKQN